MDMAEQNILVKFRNPNNFPVTIHKNKVIVVAQSIDILDEPMKDTTPNCSVEAIEMIPVLSVISYAFLFIYRNLKKLNKHLIFALK
jgi:hypothetical protein